MTTESNLDKTVAVDPRDLPVFDADAQPEVAGSADGAAEAAAEPEPADADGPDPIDAVDELVEDFIPMGAPAGAAPNAESAPAPAPYVRQRRPRHTVEPINDFAEDGTEAVTAHDSNFTTGGGMLSGHGYRRSRVEGAQLRRDLHYGQYLEIPKGRRDIFVKRERKSRILTFLALVAVLAVIAVVVYFLWEYMQVNWGHAAITSLS